MFFALAKLIELQEGYRRVFNVAGHQLLILVVDGQTYVLENTCPHQGRPLQQARIIGRVLQCPWHGIEFDLLTGRALQGQCAPLTLHKIHYQGDRVGVVLDSHDTRIF